MGIRTAGKLGWLKRRCGAGLLLAATLLLPALAPAPAGAAWRLYPQDNAASINPGLDDEMQLTSFLGVGAVSYTKDTVRGAVTPPTAATQFTRTSGGNVVTWLSYPLDAVTISGSVTFNIWAYESNTTANATVTAILCRTNAAGVIVSTMAAATLARPELGLTASAHNWSVTPTLTTLANGDRLALRLYLDDASGTTRMNNTYFAYANVAGPTAGANGDTWVQTFESLAPAKASTAALTTAETSLGAGWSLVDGATGYTLAASVNAGLAPSPVAASVFTDIGTGSLPSLSPNTTYYLYLRTHGSGAHSSWNTWAATATLAAAPAFNNFTGVTAGAAQFNWTAPTNPGNTLYRVLVSTAPDPLTPGGAVVTSSFTYNTYLSSSGLNSNTQYYFRVAAINHNSVYTAYTLPESVYTQAAVPAPSGFTLMAEDSMRFNWTSANPAGTLFRVQVSTADPASPGGAAVTTHDTYSLYLSSAGLSADTTYYFRAAAVNGAAAVSSYSGSYSTSTLAALPVFSSFGAAAYDSLQFNFGRGSNPPGARYRVLVSTATDPGVPLGAAVSSSDTYNLSLSTSGLQPDLAYRFRVAAVNHNGVASEYTAPETAYTLLRFDPGFVNFTAVSAVSARFNFSDGGNRFPETQFRVLVSTAPNPLLPDGAAVTSSDTYNNYLEAAGLEANTTYYFRAAGIGKGGALTGYSAAAGTSTLAALPAGFDFTGVSSTSVRLEWAPAGGPGTLYEALISTATDPFAPDFAAVTSSVTYNLYVSTAGLASNKAYYFRVRARNNNGLYTEYAGAVTTTTLAAGTLSSPIPGAVTPHISSFTVSWTLVSGATGYTLAASVNPDDPPIDIYASTTVLAVNSAVVHAPPLAPDTVYHLHVRANGDGRSSTWNDYPDIATLLAYPPAWPDFSAVSEQTIGFFWSENGNVHPGTLFGVKYSTAADPLAPAGAAVISSDTYNVFLDLAGLQPNTPYSFRVAGLNKDGAATAYTALASTVTRASQPLPQPFGESGLSSLLFSWLPNGNPAGTLYRVAVSTAPNPLAPGAAAYSSSDTYNVSFSTSGLIPNTTYYFSAAAVNSAGTVTGYTEVRSTATLAAEPASPAFAAAAADSLLFTWGPNGNPADTLYRVLVSTAPNPLVPDGAAVTSSDTYNLSLSSSGLSPDTRYYFRVAAVGRNGGLSGYSIAQQRRTLTKVPASPAFGVVGAASIAFGWAPNGNPQPGTLYRVLVSTAPDPALPGGAAVSVSDIYDVVFTSSGLNANTTYYFRVAGVNGDSEVSDYALPAGTSTLVANIPAFVDFTDIQIDSLRFVWSHNGNAEGTLYRVLVSTAPNPLAPGGAPVSSSDTYDVSLTTSGLLNDRQYYFMVAGVNNNGVLTNYAAVQSSRTLQAVTRLYLLDTVSTANPSVDTGEERRLSESRGSALVTYVKNTVAGAVTPPTSDSQFTKAGAGLVQTWLTMPLSPVTISGNVTFNIWAWENNAQANATITAALFRTDGNGVVISTIATVLTPRTEIGTAAQLQNWSRAATETTLANGDRLALRLYMDDGNAVTMRTGYTVSASVAGPTAGASGDSWVQVLQDLRPARPVVSNFPAVAYNQLTAAWNLVSETTGYLLAASLNNGPEPSPVYGSSETLGNLSATISVPALTANTTYFLYVRSSGEGASSGWSAFPGTATLLQYDPVPSVFPAVASDSLRFSWGSGGNPGPVPYLVLVSTAQNPLNPLGAVVTSSLTYNTFFSSAGVLADTTYYFRVAGLNHSGTPTNYTAAAGTATLLGFPPAFLSFTGIGENAIQFNWDRNNNRALSTLYRVLVSTAPNPRSPGGAAVTSSDTYNTFLSSSGLAVNTSYYFTVAGVNKNGVLTDYTAVKGTSTWAAAPSLPVFSAAAADSVSFSWSAPANPQGRTLYRVRVSTADPDLPLGAVVTSSYTYNLSLSSSGLAADTTYYFTAAAVNNDGVETAYTLTAGTATLLAYDPVVYGFASVAHDSMLFDWTSGGNRDPGTLYRVLASTAPNPRLPGGAAVTSSDTYNTFLSSAGLAADTTYYFRVAGVNKNGVETGYTLAAGTATLLAFQPVSPAFAGVTETEVQFSFDGNGNRYPGTLYRVISSTAPNPRLPDGAVAVSSYTYNLALASAALSANVTYYFTAAGVNKNGVETGYTLTAGTSTRANQPTGLYSTGVTTRTIQLNWADSGNSAWTLYEAVVSSAPDPLNPLLGEAVTSSQTYNLYISTAGLTPSTYYYFRVRARNSGGVPTAWSTPPFQVRTLATGQIGSPASGNITGVHVSSISASWSLVEGATGYTLAASLSPDNPPVSPAASSTTINNEAHAYVFEPPLAPDTVYYLFARANGDQVSGAWYAFPPYATLLAYPPAFDVFSGLTGAEARFSWLPNGNPGGTRYRVLVSTAAEPLAPGSAAFTSSDTYNVALTTSGLSSDTTYYFRVAGVNKDGVLTGWTSTRSTATWANAPVFSGFGPVSAAEIRFDWSANGNRNPGTLYQVLVSTAPDPLAPGGAVVTSSETYNLYLTTAGLAADTTYYFKAAALGVSGVNSAWTDTSSTATLVANPPSLPAITAAAETSLRFDWSANGNRYPGTLYQVLVSTAPDPLAPGGAVVTSSETYNLYLTTAGLVPNTTHYFTAAAVNLNGVLTDYTGVKGTSTLAALPLSAVSTFSAVTSLGFTAAWNAAGNPAGTLYLAQVSTAADFNAGAAGQTASTAPAAGTSYAFSGLLSSRDYYFRVRAMNHNGVYSDYAQLGSTRTLGLAAPAAQPVTQVSTYSITASWSLVPGATGYTLSASVNAGSPPSPVYASSATAGLQASLASPALALNTTYYLFVKAGGPGDESPWTVYPPTSTLAAQPLSAVSTYGAVTDNGFTVAWSANANPLGATLYQLHISTAQDFNSGASDQVLLATAPAAGPGASFGGLSNDTYYYARVRSAHNNGNFTDWTSLGFVKTLALPTLHASGDGVLLYGKTGSSSPQFRHYYAASNAFSGVQNTLSGVQGSQFVIRTNPLTSRQEAMAGYVKNGVLRVLCTDGANWYEEWTQAVGGNETTRRFDIAYESATGDALVLYSQNAAGANELGYRVKPGASECGSGAWSAHADLDPARTSGVVQWVKLASDQRASSSTIAAVWADGNSDLSAMVWNGGAWENEPASALETSLEAVSVAQDVENFDAEFEALSGDLMVVWGNAAGADGVNGVRYATAAWTGGSPLHTWGGVVTPPTFLDDATNLDLAANPASNELIFASIGNAGSDLQIGYWSGSAWTNKANASLVAQQPLAGTRLVSAVWLSSMTTTRWVVAFSSSNATNINWYYGTAGVPTLGAAASPAPAFATPQKVFQLQQDPVNRNAAMLAVSDNNSDLMVKRLTMNSAGTFTWSDAGGGAALETSLTSATVAGHSFVYWPAPPASTFEQSAYRFFANADSADVGAPLAAQDALAVAGAAGSAFRLRTLLHVGNVAVPQGGQGFRLQFAGKGDGTCDAPSNGTPAAYTDVTAATALAFNNNAAVADNAPLVQNAGDPRHGTHVNSAQAYEELNNSTNTVSAIARNQDGLWDFALKDNGLTPGAVYCVRLVKSDGLPLEYYTVYPEFAMAAEVYINEVYPAGAAAAEDWVELYNNSSSTPSLAGWKLEYVQDTIANGGMSTPLWTGQPGDLVNAHSTFTLQGFSVDLNGAQPYHVRLLNPAAAVTDQVQWPGGGALTAGQSFARISDGHPELFEIDPTPTKGYSNSAATETVKINEAAYGQQDRQFVELYNPSAVNTVTLAGYSLRNAAASEAGLKFRFTRTLHPQDYALIDFSSLSDDGLTFAQVFGQGGLAAAGDFLVLETSTGSSADAVAWQSGSAYTRYNYAGAKTELTDYAPANSAGSIVRRPSEGADTGSDFSDFVSSGTATPASRNNSSPAASNALTYPADTQAPQFLSRRFPLRLQLGAAASGGGNNLLFQRTGGSPDPRSPHVYRLADIGFNLSSTGPQETLQYGFSFADQDGWPLVSSAAYRVTLNSDTGAAAAPQIILGTVTYDASVHSVTGSTAAPAWMNDAARVAAVKLQVSNNSPAGFNGVQLTTVSFSLLGPDLVPFTQLQAQNLFNAVMLAADSLTSGTTGLYEPGIDLSTAAYIPMASITVDALGLSTLAVPADHLWAAFVPAASTRTFFVVLESTRDAADYADHVFRVRFAGADAGLRDASGLLPQAHVPSAAVTSSSVTLITPAQPPASSSWPYVSPSSAPVYTLAGSEGTGLVSVRSYIGSTDGYLRAVSGGGELLWTFTPDTLSPINSSPTDSDLEGGQAYVYFANDNGDVYKVRDNGGSATRIWKRNLATQVRSNITVSGNKLIFGAADGKVHCIDKTTPLGDNCGTWTDLAVGGTLSGTPVVDDRQGVNVAWVGTEAGALRQLRSGDGWLLQSLNTGSAIKSSPFGDVAWPDSTDKLFITSTDGNLYFAPLDLGNPEQPFSAGAPIQTSPFVWTFGGIRYVFLGDDAGRMHMVSTRTWTQPDGWPFQAGGPIRSSPVAVPNSIGNISLPAGEDYVYFGCDDGYIYAVNVHTGLPRNGWPVATGGPVRATPVVDVQEKTLTVSSTDGRTYVLKIGQ